MVFNKNEYNVVLSSVQSNQEIHVTWKMWIQATNTGLGGFLLSIPTSDASANFNPPVSFMDNGSIVALTNGTNVQVIIGNWGSLAGTAMTNTLILDYPDGTFSYSLDGEPLAKLPLGPYFTNIIEVISFDGLERFVGSLGNRFAIADVSVEWVASKTDFSFVTNNGSITINTYTGPGNAVTIPSTINGLAVSCIGTAAFFSTVVTSVVIPNTVTSIGTNAFQGCQNLTNVTIGTGVTNIEDEAFAYCGSLTNVTIPNSVILIGAYAFVGCNNLTSVTIGTNVTSINADAFYECPLTSVTIPNSVTNIGAGAFWDCTSLSSLTIGTKVASIGNSAFSYCTNLTSVAMPSSVRSIGDWAFDGTRLTNVTIGSGVTSIGTGSFYECPLIRVTIPNSVISIGDDAFDGCYPLTTITIPSSVTSIGDSAFYYCTNVTSVTIGSGVTNIGGSAFYSCTNLTSIFFEGNFPAIGGGAFQGDDRATVYYLPGTMGWGGRLSTFRTVSRRCCGTRKCKLAVPPLVCERTVLVSSSPGPVTWSLLWKPPRTWAIQSGLR